MQNVDKKLRYRSFLKYFTSNSVHTVLHHEQNVNIAWKLWIPSVKSVNIVKLRNNNFPNCNGVEMLTLSWELKSMHYAKH